GRPARAGPGPAVLHPPTSAATPCRQDGTAGPHPSDFRASSSDAPRAPPCRPPPAATGAATPTARQNAGTHSRPAAGSSSHTFTNPVGHDSASTAAFAASSTCTKLLTSEYAASSP